MSDEGRCGVSSSAATTWGRVRVACTADLDAVVRIERGAGEAPHWGMEVYRAAMAGGRRGDAIERRLLVAVADPAVNDGAVVDGESGEGTATGGDRLREQGGEVVGFVVGRVLRMGGAGVEAEIESVAVAAAWRRRGVARALCGELLRWFREQGAGRVELEVRAGSRGARALYGGLGFVEQGRRARYYAEPEEDAVLLRLREGAAETRGE